jgi:hypothetical protein
MMASIENYISASCIISNLKVFKNEVLVFENKDVAVSDFLVSIYQNFGIKYPKFYKMDNLSKLGWLATELLLKDSFIASKYKPEDVAVVFANANASLDTDVKYTETTKNIPSPALFVYTLPNIVIGEICIRHQFKGENAFFISPTFDTEFLAQYVSNLINNNILQACICGWVEYVQDEYKAVLFLIEKEQTGNGIPFTIENINKTYLKTDG